MYSPNGTISNGITDWANRPGQPTLTSDSPLKPSPHFRYVLLKFVFGFIVFPFP